MRILIEPGESQNIIVTTAIGDEYYNCWFKYAYPSWERYCKNYSIGLIVFDQEIVPKENRLYKKVYWHKLLIGSYLKEHTVFNGNVCFLDTDILINGSAPNIFDYCDSESISLVSQKNNLPYDLNEVLRRIAYFRHNFMDSRYPLDSYLFASISKIFELHNLTPQPDFACTGLFVFNIENHAQLFHTWYYKYSSTLETMDGGTEEVHLNYEIQNYGKIRWLEYKFQALWIYEMAAKYPFLYLSDRDSPRLIQDCIESSLLGNYFLHFAGAWEGHMWKIENILQSEPFKSIYDGFAKYMELPVCGEPKGVIKPKE